MSASDRERTGSFGAFQCLAIETSSATGSLALTAGEQCFERTIATPREQTATVLALADELLGEAGLRLADLDALAFGRGPGSFTGLRVAAAVAQGLAFATGLPIVPVSSLAALALPAFARHSVERVLCCVDARMGEVYWAVFERGGSDPDVADLSGGAAAPGSRNDPSSRDRSPVAVGAERIGLPSSVAIPKPPFIAVGDGFAAHADTLRPQADGAWVVDERAVPQAVDVLTLARAAYSAGRTVAVEAALPVYLRGPDAWQRN